MAQIRYFLGGNTPVGFYSLYDQLSDRSRVTYLYILKGGAGCGKSTLMKHVAARVEAAGVEAERILCSGDPDSLDGVFFPSLSAAVADGTYPHVLEAGCVGAADRYIDLSRFYRRSQLLPLREEIIAATDRYRSRRRDAYRSLQAAGLLLRERYDSADSAALRTRLEKRAQGIIRRELKKSGHGSGTLSRQFLTAITHRGATALWETAEAQADRIFRLSDSYGTAHLLLDPLCSAARAADYDVITCPDPMEPDRTAHLLIPELRLAFLSDSPLFPAPERANRHLRLDAVAEQPLDEEYRSRLRLGKKLTSSLLEDTVSGLAESKREHDVLEGLYNPHVDFDGVVEQADEIARELLG